MQYKYGSKDTDWEKEKLYVDPRTAWLRWSNEIEKRTGIMDDEFFERNRLLVADASKELPLGNFRSKETIKLLRLRRMNMIDEQDAGLTHLAEETMMANKADIQTSRAVDGFNAQLNVTQRQIWEETTRDKQTRGMFNRLFKGKEKPPQPSMEGFER